MSKEKMDAIVKKRISDCEENVQALKVALAQAEAELKAARRDGLFWENVRESQ